MLACIERAQAQGLTGDEAIMAAFEENARDLLASAEIKTMTAASTKLQRKSRIHTPATHVIRYSLPA